jgi:hypothetical protein
MSLVGLLPAARERGKEHMAIIGATTRMVAMAVSLGVSRGAYWPASISGMPGSSPFACSYLASPSCELVGSFSPNSPS